MVKKKLKKKVKSFKLGKLTIPLYGRLNLKGKKWAALRKYCEQRDGGKRCVNYNDDCYGALHLHHKIPVKDGGTNRPSNLVWICHTHHCIEHPFMIKMLIKRTERKKAC
jgi:hypothetical protein